MGDLGGKDKQRFPVAVLTDVFFLQPKSGGGVETTEVRRMDGEDSLEQCTAINQGSSSRPEMSWCR
jgi:hypothetical protein